MTINVRRQISTADIGKYAGSLVRTLEREAILPSTLKTIEFGWSLNANGDLVTLEKRGNPDREYAIFYENGSGIPIEAELNADLNNARVTLVCRNKLDNYVQSGEDLKGNIVQIREFPQEGFEALMDEFTRLSKIK